MNDTVKGTTIKLVKQSHPILEDKYYIWLNDSPEYFTTDEGEAKNTYNLWRDMLVQNPEPKETILKQETIHHL